MGGLSFDISLNKSERPVCIGCDSVHMSVPAEVAGDIHPQVPGAADSLQHLSMQYILRLERVPGGCLHLHLHHYTKLSHLTFL